MSDKDGTLVVDKPTGKYVVLGHDTLTEIHQDIEKIKFPSWFPNLPKHPGKVKWGKFKAEEWKSFCLAVLPITLT